MIIMSNLIYLAILLLATYGIGKKLYNSKVGIFSAFLVSMFPTTFALSRIFQIELALTSMVALSFYLFVLNNFRSLKFALLTGIVMGLGMLTKQSYFIFLLPILIYFFFQNDNLKNKVAIRNFFIALFIALVISAAWYLNRVRIGWKAQYYYIFQCRGNQDFLFYLKSLFFRQLFPIYFLLFLISVIFFIKKRKYFIPVMIFILLVLFSLSTNKEDRYILPIFPYIAIMISAWGLSLPRIKRVLVPSIIFFSFFQFFLICYGNILPGSKDIFLKKYFSHRFSVRWGLFSKEIDHENWRDPIEKTIKTIKNDTSKDTALVLFISDDIYIPPEIQYQSLIQKFPITFLSPGLDTDYSNLSDFEFNMMCYDWINRSEFVMLEKKYNDNIFALMHARKLLNYFKQDFNEFEYVDNIQFPGNRLFLIYKKAEKNDF
jgi:hypothetical protein